MVLSTESKKSASFIFEELNSSPSLHSEALLCYAAAPFSTFEFVAELFYIVRLWLLLMFYIILLIWLELLIMLRLTSLMLISRFYANSSLRLYETLLMKKPFTAYPLELPLSLTLPTTMLLFFDITNCDPFTRLPCFDTYYAFFGDYCCCQVWLPC
jgi:hypothetical protein